MALIVSHGHSVTSNPLKLSAPLGASMAFMGMDGTMPLLHGSQGCTAFALVMLVRHFREAIPLQTTAMNEVSTILGGMDQVEAALLNIAKRTKPKIIGLISTALTETRGEDMKGDLKLILARNPELADIKVIPVSAPDFTGSLETGWGKAVTAIINALAEPASARAQECNRVNILPGVHQSPGDIEHLVELVEEFGLKANVLPDLSGSVDGHVPDHFIPTTLGGATVENARALGRAKLTIAIGEHMRISAETLQEKTGVPYVLFDRLTGLEASDRLMVCLSTAAGKPVPAKIRRARSQLIDAMLDGHFYFGGRKFAIAGEPDFLWSWAKLIADMGGELAAAITSVHAAHLTQLPCQQVIIGDFQDMEDQILEAGGADLVISNTNARLSCQSLGIPHFRAGFPVYDRLGGAHRVHVGYRGTRDLIFQLANVLIEHPGHDHGPVTHPPQTTEHDHVAAPALG
ncbi:Nitrogenase molybdenum-iron cofactor biosynthesis protein [Magnetospirillum gryphiswaldense MSR-1 v2]|uniref:Nitrogenase iron-molybdenum cofactor biosynthesis protein NifN n=1 Tax=Magnetospirillum gryphiswaldense (strain DSM 6361 / JCM 21280 / NBRC 15271 / MSR-1) TaxID=431944 RepID=V6EWQ5_MAGGM|nr:nitrogenase iron-molybdenum cofactor biosynthesis protein NifN [Magnetospirillum gryphiswaldense]CDK97522.1 Nitrogenase molybdenum-iron cofactor biosynthesis protein [Magnetospirillum gryphiswaldense MSR-1 v2]